MLKRIRSFLSAAALHLLYAVLCFAALIPILYTLVLSLSGQNAVLTAGGLLNRHWSLDAYRAILLEEPFLIWLLNSLKISLCTMVLAVSSAVFAAYAFSRWRFRGRRALLNVLLVLNAFPQMLTMFALFRLFRELNLLNTHIGLILIYSGSMCIFSTWNLKGYFDTIPKEIEEAAFMDGASSAAVVVRIVLPLARPAILVTGIMVLISVWNEYLFATTFMMNADTYTLAGGLYQLQSNDYSRSWPLFTAASMLVSLPILAVFFSVQKYMVSGLTAGGVKG
ncbi:MAG: ABC transporter permease subunit [Clostridia bacterium]